MQRFLIVTNSASSSRYAATASQRDKITGLLQGKGWHVWHWFEDLWLLATDTEGTKAAEVRDEILEALDGAEIHIFVLEVEHFPSLASKGPSSSIPWIRKHWGRGANISAPAEQDGE